MENIVSNPGFQHLVINIFLNLNYKDLKACQLINQSANEILNNPMFWIRKFIQRGMSKENQKHWIKAIQSVTNSSFKEKSIILYLKWNLKKGGIFDLPCYTSSAVQNDFRTQITKRCGHWKCNENTEIIKILAPLTDNPNAPTETGWTPMHGAAYYGHTEIVKILAPLTNNPNPPDKDGKTPIHMAAWKGHTEIVKILAPLTDNPNAPTDNGYTPIYWAAENGHTEIIKILAPLTGNPNAPDKWTETPMHWAAHKGHTEIVKTLIPLTDNLNVQNIYGSTPIQHAIEKGHTEIVKILESLTGNPNAENVTRCKK